MINANGSITIYRIVQDSSTTHLNMQGRKTVIVQITKTEQSLAITVRNDGDGFDTLNFKKIERNGLDQYSA